jgi:hypothetical protein
MRTLSSPPVGRGHLAYRETHPTRDTRTSPPRCRPDRAVAEQHREATTALAGPARYRRTWTITRSTCDDAS